MGDFDPVCLSECTPAGSGSVVGPDCYKYRQQFSAGGSENSPQLDSTGSSPVLVPVFKHVAAMAVQTKTVPLVDAIPTSIAIPLSPSQVTSLLSGHGSEHTLNMCSPLSLDLGYHYLFINKWRIK